MWSKNGDCKNLRNLVLEVCGRMYFFLSLYIRQSSVCERIKDGIKGDFCFADTFLGLDD